MAIKGSFFERYRNDYNRNNGGISSQGLVTFGAITGTYRLTPSLSAYVRLAGEGITQGGQGRDFNGAYYDGTHGYRGALAFDQFGLTYDDSKTGIHVVAGRQGKSLDATSTIYDQSWRVGSHIFLDGISVSKNLGKWTAEIDAYSEDQYVATAAGGTPARNGIYAARGSYVVSPTLTAGATLARYTASAASEAAGNKSVTSGEGDVIWKATNRLECRFEYGRSDADTRNELYFATAKYKLSKRDTAAAIAYKIGQFADLGGGTAYPNNNRGTRYYVQHDFDNKTSIQLFHEADHEIYGPGSSGSDQVTISVSF
jgi:hypothetical protein